MLTLSLIQNSPLINLKLNCLHHSSLFQKKSSFLLSCFLFVNINSVSTLTVSLVNTATTFILLVRSVKSQSWRETETWAWLSRMVDRGRRCPFKILAQPGPFWHETQCCPWACWSARLSLALSRKRSSPKGCSKIIS